MTNITAEEPEIRLAVAIGNSVTCDRQENGRSENCNYRRQCFNRETLNVSDLSDEAIRERMTGNLCRSALLSPHR